MLRPCSTLKAVILVFTRNLRRIISEVDQHNNNVSDYATKINERIRTGISKTKSVLVEYDVNSHLTFRSYYLMNIRRHLGNAYPDNRTELLIKEERENNTAIFCLYSGPNRIGLGDKRTMNSLQNFVQRFTPIVFKEI